MRQKWAQMRGNSLAAILSGGEYLTFWCIEVACWGGGEVVGWRKTGSLGVRSLVRHQEGVEVVGRF